MMGAHVIKCGLSPIVIDLLKRGIISIVALNGAGAIHDVEAAYWGQTSEEVEKNLQDGTFGMSQDTAKILNETILLTKNRDLGFGEVLGKKISEDKPEFHHVSILANAYELDIPVTIHAAIGTDIVHQHHNADGAAIGERILRDFRFFAKIVSLIGNGGVVLNIGSSVVLPEVFLKALTVAKNLDHSIDNFFTANFDMIQHYRPQMNVIQRPTVSGGKGYNFTGHHELMIPFLSAAIIEKIQN
jgi:deoxyhypusine synthase